MNQKEFNELCESFQKSLMNEPETKKAVHSFFTVERKMTCISRKNNFEEYQIWNADDVLTVKALFSFGLDVYVYYQKKGEILLSSAMQIY